MTDYWTTKTCKCCQHPYEAIAHLDEGMPSLCANCFRFVLQLEINHMDELTSMLNDVHESYQSIADNPVWVTIPLGYYMELIR